MTGLMRGGTVALLLLLLVASTWSVGWPAAVYADDRTQPTPSLVVPPGEEGVPAVRPRVGIPASGYEPGKPMPRALAPYAQAVEAAGGVPVPIPVTADRQALRAAYQELHALLLAGGPNVDPKHYGEKPEPDLGPVDEARDAAELALARWALEEGKPILGICRGNEVLNVAGGGSLHQSVRRQVEGALIHARHTRAYTFIAHDVAIVPGSRLASLLGPKPLGVNSRHFQAVKEPAPRFAAAAHAPDSVIEAIERQDGHFALGVQWHPERLYETDPRHLAIFEALVRAAKPVD